MQYKILKKILSLFTIFALFSLMPVYDAVAEEISLQQLASSLGADTDYFSFPNYRPTECSDELIPIINEKKQVNAEVGLQLCTAGGLCNSFAILEVLNHNGVITPSDLQEGAENLNDVECTPYVNDVMCYYSVLQGFRFQDFVYKEYFCSHDLKEQCQDLIDYGEKAVETGKWFFIAFKSEKIAHAIVGIGIADGNWTYNDKTYDKCILTLDSNFKDKNDSTKSAGFTERGCIYINSEKQEFYFPAYECDSANEDTFITLLTDDTDMLNSYGYINPSESHSEKYDRLKLIQLIHGWCGEYDISVEVNGVTEKYHAYPNSVVEGLTKNQWSNTIAEHESQYYREADKITLESMQDEKKYVQCIIRDTEGYMNEIDVMGKGRESYANNEFSYTNLETKEGRYFFYATRISEDFAFPWNGIMANGVCNDSITMKLSNDGIVFSSNDNTIRFNGLLEKLLYDKDLNFIGTNQDFNVFSSKDFMIRCKENTDEIYFAIGENFDIPVETGDVNCDGYINAIDASYILSDYANAAIGVKPFLNKQLADYNSDGTVNAVDASFVLSEYARHSTL